MFRIRALNKSDNELKQEIDSLAIEFEELHQSEPTLSDKRLEETRQGIENLGKSGKA